MTEPRKLHELWMEQCEAAGAIKERYGLKAAFDYLVGEKLLNFTEAASEHERRFFFWGGEVFVRGGGGGREGRGGGGGGGGGGKKRGGSPGGKARAQQFAMIKECDSAVLARPDRSSNANHPCHAHRAPARRVQVLWHDYSVASAARVGPEVGAAPPSDERGRRLSAIEGRPSVPDTPSARQHVTRRRHRRRIAVECGKPVSSEGCFDAV